MKFDGSIELPWYPLWIDKMYYAKIPNVFFILMVYLNFCHAWPYFCALFVYFILFCVFAWLSILDNMKSMTNISNATIDRKIVKIWNFLWSRFLRKRKKNHEFVYKDRANKLEKAHQNNFVSLLIENCVCLRRSTRLKRCANEKWACVLVRLCYGHCMYVRVH